MDSIRVRDCNEKLFAVIDKNLKCKARRCTQRNAQFFLNVELDFNGDDGYIIYLFEIGFPVVKGFGEDLFLLI